MGRLLWQENDNGEKVKSKLEKFLTEPYVYFDCETKSKKTKVVDDMFLVGDTKDAINMKENEITVIALASPKHEQGYIFKDMKKEDKDALKKIMKSKKIKKLGHNMKGDCKWIHEHLGVKVEGIFFDSYFSAQLLDERIPAGLAKQCEHYLGIPSWKFDYKKKHSYQEWLELCLPDVRNGLALCKVHLELLHKEPRLLNLLKVEMMVMRRFYDTELTGIPLDIDYLKEIIARFERHLNTRLLPGMHKYLISQGIKELNQTAKKNGEEVVVTKPITEVNFNSPIQMKTILYDEDYLEYPEQFVYKKGEKKVTTGVDAMVEIARLGKYDYAFARWILVYRYWTKLISVCETLIKNTYDGVYYQNFNTYGTETGRMTEPYLMCMPSKTKVSLKIRNCIKGNLMVADYSNMELRMIGNFTNDPKLAEIYGGKGSGDAHTEMQMSIKKNYKINVVRRQAKTTNFSTAYGIFCETLAKKINTNESRPWVQFRDLIDGETAQKFIEAFDNLYYMISYWKDKTINDSKTTGYVESLLGRKRRIDWSQFNPDSKRDKWKIEKAERELLNYPIQTTSGEVVKLAICALPDENIIIDVHDEIVILNPKKSIAEVKEIMENVAELPIKMIVEPMEVSAWGDAK